MADPFKVDFFIIGFPKCGTTSLATYLGQHPNVCFSDPKEPYYFTDIEYDKGIKSLTDYKNIFKKNGVKKKLGEGTVATIYSLKTLQRILDHNPNAKFIICLRNPLEIVQSMHSHLLKNLEEDIEDLEQAWDAQDERKTGKRMPLRIRASYTLQYAEIAKQGKYIEQLFSLVNPKNCHLIFFEELQKKPRLCYLNTLHFLELDDDGLNTFNVKNENRSFKAGMLGSLGKIFLAFIRHPRWIHWRNKFLVSNFHIEDIIRFLCQESRKRASINQSLQEKIISTFEDDIKLLESITKKNLAHWRQL